MKTYSLCFLNPNKTGLDNGKPYWVTNWYEYASKNDINFKRVKEYCSRKGYLAYGVMYGHNSRNLTSARCREILWERNKNYEKTNRKTH
jgi:hypothetical protein